MATQSEIEVMQAHVAVMDAIACRLDESIEIAKQMQDDQNERFGYLTDASVVLRKADAYGIGCQVVA